MIVALPTGRKLINTAEAARILGVTMGRMRQLALMSVEDGGVNSWLAAPTARMFDEAEIRERARRKPPGTGRPRGGFKPN